MTESSELLTMLTFSLKDDWQEWDWTIWMLFNSSIAMAAIIVDRLLGEFLQKSHPVVLIGKWVKQFEKHYYRDDCLSGTLLNLSTLLIVGTTSLILLVMSFFLPVWLQFILLVMLSSTLLAHRMLFDSVKAVSKSESPSKTVAMLVSRDCDRMDKHTAYQAAIESYGENLSDGMVAPWLYLVCLNVVGITVYKSINTLDSMVGYRTERYEKFGKTSAKVDDLANLIPSRLTALMILSFTQWFHVKSIKKMLKMGAQHSSPNAGYPITAIAMITRTQLGGPTYYFSELKPKPYFGLTTDTKMVEQHHILQALTIRNKMDALLITFSSIILLISNVNS